MARSFWSVASNGNKLAQLFGGALATEVVFALALDAACRAYGVDLHLSQLLVVNVVSSTLAALVPVPGGTARPRRRSPPGSSRWASRRRPPSPLR